jgi:hypothetical protein
MLAEPSQQGRAWWVNEEGFQLRIFLFQKRRAACHGASRAHRAHECINFLQKKKKKKNDLLETIFFFFFVFKDECM